ncbi:hypothetical protein DFQ28_004159, partial [Apophysomyces sp. BC1034]
MRYVTNAKGEQIVISRSGEVIIADDHGRERERHKIPYGATLLQLDGVSIKAGTLLATWDPMTRPIITEYGGTVKFENVEEGVTVAKQIDEVTGLSTLVVIDSKRRGSQSSRSVRPQVKLLDASGEEVKIPGTEHAVQIGFQVGALITVKDGQQVQVGEVLARIPTESQKTRDITVPHEFLIAKEKQVLVHDGQVVNKGEMIVDGPADPHDILRLQGVEALSRYIVDEVQDVYRLQG